MLRTTAFLGSVLIAVACAEKKEEEESDTLEITSETILQFQNKRAEATPVEAGNFGKNFPYMLSSTAMSEHYSSEGTSTDEDTSGSVPATCSDQAYTDGMKISTEGNRLIFAVNVQLTADCIAEEKALAQADLTTNGSAAYTELKSLTAQTIYVCENDMSNYTIDDLMAQGMDATCGYPTGLSRNLNFDGKTTYWFIENGETVEFSGDAVQQQFLMDADGNPCVWNRTDSTIEEENGCVSGSYNKAGVSQNPIVTYTFAIRKDLVGVIGPYDWYDSGKLEVQANDWEGTLTYNGHDQLPTYQMTKDGRTTTGTFDPYNLKLTNKNWLKPQWKMPKFKLK